MKRNQIAAQMYTVRNFTKYAKGIAESLKKVRAIGYEAIQASAMADIGDAELVKMLEGEGLVLCATHEDSQALLNDPQSVADKLDRLNCKYTAYPYPGGIALNTLADVQALAKKLDDAGAVLRKAGKVLTYHNHHIEFRKFDGKLMLDVLYDETDPQNLLGEIDTYWVQYGGGNPVKWCKKLTNRLPLLHLKDFMITPENTITYAEIGSGNLDWQKIIPAAEASGCKWFIVEQDETPADPFDSLKKSFEFLSSLAE